MEKRINPFNIIYTKCNSGTNIEKYSHIKEGLLCTPRCLDVELTNVCNFKCCFCPAGTNSMQRTRGFMPENVFDRLLANIEKHQIAGVRVIVWGEPTLHPQWFSMLEAIKNVCGGGTLLHLGTNGSRLTEDQMESLVALGLDSIKFSFQGAGEESYNEMRDGGDYAHLLETVKKMKLVRGDALKPFIQVSTTLTTETKEQVDSFRQEIEQYCDYCNIGYTMLTHLSVDAMNISEKQKEKIRKMQQQESLCHEYRKVCSDAFDKLDIHWNGDAVLCCSDYDNFMVVGNILDMDVPNIFTSRIADLYRDIIAKGEYGRIKCCSTCWETVPLTT